MNLDEIFNTQPPPKKRRRSKRKGLEATVVRECLKFLKADPRVIYVERRNTGAVQFQDGGFMRFGSKGAADIWCLIERDVGSCGDMVAVTTHIEIECKRADGKGRLSFDQKEFRQFCDKSGIPYFLVTSVEELKLRLAEFLQAD